MFGVVLGLAGLGNAWRICHRLWQLPGVVGEGLMLAAAVLRAGLVVAYAGKWLTARPAARAEFAHPVQSGFVARLPLTTLLMALAAAATIYCAAACMRQPSYDSGRRLFGTEFDLA